METVSGHYITHGSGENLNRHDPRIAILSTHLKMSLNSFATSEIGVVRQLFQDQKVPLDSSIAQIKLFETTFPISIIQ